MIYAVIDTNVFVSALFSKNINAATVKVLDAIFQGDIVSANWEFLQNVLRVMKFFQIKMMWCFMRLPFLKRMLTL